MKCYLIFASLCALWRDDVRCFERKINYVIACYENNLGVRLRCDGANNLGTMLLCDCAINLGTSLR